MTPFRILSIDGGGLRGIVPVRILQQLEKITGKRVHEMFDMMAGTSTGGLIACFLTLRHPENPSQPLYTIDTLADVYTRQGSTIFPPPSNRMARWVRDARALFSPRYSDEGINKVVHQYVSTDTHAPRLVDALLPIVVSTYDLKTNQPVFFKTSEAQEDASANARIFDICRATSAAPTYLPAYSFIYKNNPVTCIDGGVYVNNPTMAAIAEIKRWGAAGFYKKRDGSPVKDLSEVRMISLGTGSYSGDITEKQAEKWGSLEWVTQIIDIMMKGVNQSTDYEAREMMDQGDYVRASITISNKQFADMADASATTLRYLEEEIQKQITGNSILMKELVKLVE